MWILVEETKMHFIPHNIMVDASPDRLNEANTNIPT